jgi:hypothetical protein
VRALHGDDARIPAQHLGELSAPHVESIDARRAAPQQNVGEAAGGGTHVEAHSSGYLNRELIQRGPELLTPAGDEARLLDRCRRRGWVDQVARLSISASAVTLPDPDPTGEKQALGLVAIARDAAFDEQIVQPDTARAGFAQAVRASISAGRDGLSPSVAMVSCTCSVMPSTSSRR